MALARQNVKLRQQPGRQAENRKTRLGAPAWLRPVIVLLSILLLAGLFSREISDSDFWWHLKTGQYIWQTRALPTPDPFAYTTATAKSAYPGEEITRHFNLTHEWLAQVLMYLTWRVAGFGGIVLGRSALLIAFCALAGLIAYLRCRGFYRATAAMLAAAAVAHPLLADRPYLLTYVFLGLTVLILESRRRSLLWLLPPLMLIWANSHGGFIVGWVVILAYLAESLLRRFRNPSAQGDLRLWIAGPLSLLLTALNPNGLQVFRVLTSYRHSALTATLLEWRPPALWPPTVLSGLLLATAIILLLARRRVRAVDWMLFAAFAAAALTAGRNTFLIGLLAPILVAAYLPWNRPFHRYAEMGAAILLLAGAAGVFADRRSFQLRVAEWAYPAGAAEFLLAHHITARMFNTYEYGGYLTWRLWPQERVFIDGRALSESVFHDYERILYDSDNREGKSAAQLLDDYGVDVVVMNYFEYTSGLLYVIAPALADADTFGWSLVYADPQAMIFFRHPPENMPILDSAKVLPTIESECELHIQHEPWFPGCARNLGQMFSRTGDFANGRRWLGMYLEHAPGKDAGAQAEFQRLLQAGN
jgi:hypothetical protein